MAGWSTLNGRIVHWPQDNVDTDQLIPARFMSVPRSEGYGGYLLHDVRRDAGGTLHADHPLNAHHGDILLAGRNFGSGSSREAAVYALVDAGFKAVIAPSFGDIFASNAANNGLLAAPVSDADHAKLGSGPARIDIAQRMITQSLEQGSVQVPFTLDDTWATKLINGWDDIDLTQQHAAQIEAYASDRHDRARWTWPRIRNAEGTPQP